jgi:hypothetical protein
MLLYNPFSTYKWAVWVLWVVLSTSNFPNMPRTNRIERASQHPNPVIGYIMLLQEKIKILGRSLVGCQCSLHETELASLRVELSSLQEQFRLSQTQYSKLKLSSQEGLANYRSRINTLLSVNSSRLSLHLCQEKAYKAEILALRQHVRSLVGKLKASHLRPSLSYLYPWKANFTTSPVSWSLDPIWKAGHPNEDPGPNPAIGPSVSVDLDNIAGPSRQ